MHSKMAADKAKSHGLTATALLEETLQSIAYLLICCYLSELLCCLFFTFSSVRLIAKYCYCV